jgi:plastocyanin
MVFPYFGGLMKLLVSLVTVLALTTTMAANAQDATFSITIKDHKFEPSTVTVPAGKKFKLIVKNLDTTPEEFESSDLHREKVIAGGKEAVIALGPLKAGTYRFIGEFNPKTAQGTLVAQ